MKTLKSLSFLVLLEIQHVFTYRQKSTHSTKELNKQANKQNPSFIKKGKNEYKNGFISEF